MSILQSIVTNTKAKLIHKKEELSLKQIKSSLEDLDLPRGRFKDNISNKDEAIIAEIKKASPSKGIIREDFDPDWTAKQYEKGGAACLSILTEPDFFLGSLDYLLEVRKICHLPILRKDFIIDEIQILESKAFGADCILLIASILDKNKAPRKWQSISKNHQLISSNDSDIKTLIWFSDGFYSIAETPEKDTYVFKDLRYPMMNEEDPNSSVFNFKIKKKKQRWMAQPFYPKEVKEKDISAFWKRLKGI